MNDIDNAKLREAVINKIMPATMDLWKKKNDEYSNVPFMFGELGEVVEIVRKALKLRAAVYEHQSMDFEDVETIAMDLIGHALMFIYMTAPAQWDDQDPAWAENDRGPSSVWGRAPGINGPGPMVPYLQCPEVFEHKAHSWTLDVPDDYRWCCGVQQTKNEILHCMGPMRDQPHSTHRWIGQNMVGYTCPGRGTDG